MSLTSPARTPACTAAPTATTSSGFTPWWGSLPKNFFTVSLTIGMRVEPPTRTTSTMSFGCFFASCSALRTGSIERSTSAAHHLLELRARQAQIEVHGAARADREEREVDPGLLHARQLDLRLLRGLLQSLKGHLVLGDVDAARLLELGRSSSR